MTGLLGITEVNFILGQASCNDSSGAKIMLKIEFWMIIALDLIKNNWMILEGWSIKTVGISVKSNKKGSQIHIS